jgi:hypothetical protein
MGDDIATMMADMVTRNSPDTVRTALDNMEAAGCEEVFLVPATADLEEIDRLEAILSSR